MRHQNLRLAIAMFGCAIIVCNLVSFLGFHLSALSHIVSDTQVAVLTLSFFVWLSALAGIFAPFLNHFEEGASSTQEMFARWSRAFALGWFMAFFCVATGVESYGFSGSILTLMFFTAWSFAAAICMVQEMPRIKIEAGLSIRFA